MKGPETVSGRAISKVRLRFDPLTLSYSPLPRNSRSSLHFPPTEKEKT
jgi:hypothetical protein